MSSKPFIPNGPTTTPSGNFHDLLVDKLKALDGAGSSPGGPDTSVQINSSGTFSGSSDLTYSNSTLTAGNTVMGSTQLGFFGNSSVQQNLDTPTLEAVVQLLQNYGLSIGPPWYQQGSKILISGNTPSFQGIVTLSSDGNTMAIGGPYDLSDSIGATWVFIRSGTNWIQQAGPLVGTGYTGTQDIAQGISVALSSDGNTLAVGGVGDDSSVGATWVFTRTGTTWTQQGPKILALDSTGLSYQGTSIALSSDGNTLAVGGVGDNSNVGATWIFTRTGTTWTQQGTKILALDSTGQSRQGNGVSLSADGNTLAVGGYGDDSQAGATWIFTRTGITWTQQGPKILALDASPQSNQGFSVALSSDGNTLVTGGLGDNAGIGASWVFTRSGSIWTQQGLKLVGSGYTGPANQGSSVSISSDGNTFVVGGYSDNFLTGALWVFSRNNGNWTQQGFKLVPNDYKIAPSIGFLYFVYQNSVSISGDGLTIAGGAIYDDNLPTGIGAVWTFVKRQP